MNASSSACRLLACHRFVLPSHEANKPERHVNRKQRDFYDVKHERHHHTSTAMAAEFHQQQPLDLKMVFLGDSAVGKTALLRRFNTGFPPRKINQRQPMPTPSRTAYNWMERGILFVVGSGTLGGRIRTSPASFVPRNRRFSVMF